MTDGRPDFAKWLSDTNDITRMFLAAGRIPGLINLAGGLPEPSIYPAASIADIAKRVIVQHPDSVLGYGPIEGLPALREFIAARFTKPGLRLVAENVLITTGGMQGLDLIGKVLLNEGDVVAAQSPAYLGALDAWRPRRPTYRPFYPESDHFSPGDAIAGAKFAYTVPNFSNPTGRLFPTGQRQDFVDAAQRHGHWLVEDDPYGTLYYDCRPLPTLLGLAGDQGADIYDGPVIYLGTLSKQLVPGLRIGWIVAAPALIEALTIAKQGSDMCTSGLSQRVALEGLEQGLDKQIESQILDTYRQRRDALCASLSRHLGPWFTWETPVGGMFVWAVARDPNLDTNQLLKVAMEEKVCVTPSCVFDPDGNDRRAIRINFTFNPPEKLEEGVRRLARATQIISSTTA